MDRDVMQKIIQLVDGFNNKRHDRTPLLDLCKVLDTLPAVDLGEVFAYYSNLMNEFRAPVLDLIRAKLDIQLTREHVDAQAKMSAAADVMQTAGLALARESNRLSRYNNWLAGAAVFLGLVGLIQAIQTAVHH